MRNYRLLEISTQYNGYLSYFYNKHPKYEEMDYEELLHSFFDDAFSEAGHIHKYLNVLGNESTVVFCNNRNLQDKSPYRKENQSYFELLIEEVKAYNPDVLYITDINYFTKTEMIELSNCGGKKRILVGYDFCIPHGKRFLENASLYEQVYTGSLDTVKEYREMGLKSFLLRHAFEPSISDRVSDIPVNNSVGFCGSINISQHINRLDVLNRIYENAIPFSGHVNINEINHLLYAVGLDTSDCKKYLTILSNLVGMIEPSVYGIDYYKALRSNKVALNVHTSLTNNGAGNVRMFESTGVGACLLTDRRSGNEDLFVEDEEIVTYSSEDEMVEKAKWLLDNPTEAEKIAKAGQRRTLRDYTYERKAGHLNEYIHMLLK